MIIYDNMIIMIKMTITMHIHTRVHMRIRMGLYALTAQVAFLIHVHNQSHEKKECMRTLTNPRPSFFHSFIIQALFPPSFR